MAADINDKDSNLKEESKGCCPYLILEVRMSVLIV
jgi:hypothetical protein